jgi:2Fe-2S ferredoxin
MAKVEFIDCDGTSRIIDGDDGTSVMKAAINNEVPGILGDCGGALTCATCHVYVDEAWLSRTGEAGEIEQTMLECAIDPQSNSRLCCQIEISSELDGLVVRVPKTQF